MLCSKFRQIILTRSTLPYNVQHRCLRTSSFAFKKWVYFDGLFASLGRRDISRGMSSLRIILKDIRLWSAWTRSNIVSNVVRRCKKDRSVREVIQCFRQAFLRPRRTLLFSATAVYKTHGDSQEPPPSCDENITDVELQALLEELEGVQTLTRSTLYCPRCGKRLVIEKKLPGVQYCACEDASIATGSSDGWVPYMEAEDVLIWRKEYKAGQGLYAYKVYGRYKDVRASDFAAVQVDGAYRRTWDTAVASLAVVEYNANGLPDQAVLHWEVLWPRLFANRDYVYIRRHKEYDVNPTQNETKSPEIKTTPAQVYNERTSVHSNAKRKAIEATVKEEEKTSNRIYVIVSKSCEHAQAPPTKNAIRVTEYWSHMVVKTLDGPEKNGMEFVLTYYDEPAVGGMPSSVASWASGRAAPTYLQRMRTAAAQYRAWRRAQPQKKLPDFTPFDTKPVSNKQPEAIVPVCEEDMETSKEGPEMECTEATTRDESTQTDAEPQPVVEVKVTQPEPEVKGKVDKSVATETPTQEAKMETISSEAEEKSEEEEFTGNGGWWRYMYPFYYFV